MKEVYSLIATLDAQWITLTALILFGLFFSIASDGFLQLNNIMVVLRQSSIIAIIAVGSMIPMLTGGIDLSIGSVAGLAGIMTVGAMVQTGNMWMGILAGLAVGFTAGLINGLIVTKVGIQDIIVTLATLFTAHGLTYAYTGGHPIYEGIVPSFLVFGQGRIGIISMPIIIAIVAIILVAVMLNHTTLGRAIYAVGGNSKVAFVSGIAVDRIKIVAYAISGTFSAIGGIVMASRLGSGQPAAGESFLLDVVAAIILGGVAMQGGRGRVSGALIGVLIIGVLSNGLTLLGANYYMQEILKGMMIVLAVTLNSLREKRFSM